MPLEEYHLWLAEFARQPFGDNVDRHQAAAIGAGIISCWSKRAVPPERFIPTIPDPIEDQMKNQIGWEMFKVWAVNYNQKTK